MIYLWHLLIFRQKGETAGPKLFQEFMGAQKKRDQEKKAEAEKAKEKVEVVEEE